MQTRMPRERDECMEPWLPITALSQEKRGNGICRQMDLQRLIAMRALDLLTVPTVGAAVGEDKHAAAVGVLRSDVIHIWKIAVGSEDAGAAAHESGVVGKGSIEPAARELMVWELSVRTPPQEKGPTLGLPCSSSTRFQLTIQELDLVLLPPHALRHAAVLVGVDLVLNGYGGIWTPSAAYPWRSLTKYSA
jgi:hypothetical protein